jgi:hypothetical protein
MADRSEPRGWWERMRERRRDRRERRAWRRERRRGSVDPNAAAAEGGGRHAYGHAPGAGPHQGAGGAGGF